MTDTPLLQDWINALRSGHFDQGKSHLHNEDGTMCCLGVACQVAADKYGDVGAISALNPEVCEEFLPYSVSNMLEAEGVTLTDPSSNDVVLEEGLCATTANDEKGLSFDEIADKLESTYGHLLEDS